VRVSIIVPARNEARRIVGTLASLQPLRCAGHEVIVVDGGSTDATLELAAPFADRAFVAPPGRAKQMNAGAQVATGDALLFLHADSELTEGRIAAMTEGMKQTGRRWGRFDVTIAGASRVFPLVGGMMNARSRLTGIATGDQAVFVERALFGDVGGYPDQPLMEDVELSRRLKRAAGAPLCVSQRVVTSGRRWEREGTWRTIFAMWRLRYAYWRGVEPAKLARRYQATPASPVVLQIFAKNPVPGQVKTRLALTIGDEDAAAVYCDLVERTLALATAARAAGLVDRIELWCAPDIAPMFATWRDRHRVRLKLQVGRNLGAKMKNALDSALAEGHRAIVIGTDCPAMDVSYLARAVAALDDHAAVVGPAEDGGYVLVGLSRAVDAFSGIPWSSPNTMAATREKLRGERVRWSELPTLWDVDEPADLARWRALSATNTAHANARELTVSAR
jgi:rSAM/selenodomain-associated transferase 2/rSAM/selenodomain-associated transferase 1